MNILFINNAFPTKSVPQRATYAREVMNCLIQAGNHVDKIVMNIDGKNTLDKIRNYINFYFRLLFTDYKKFDAVYINHYPYCFLPVAFHLKKIDKLFIHWHGMDLIPLSVFKRIYYAFTYSFIPRRAWHIVPSNYLKGILKKNIEVPDKRIHISPSGGINTQIFTDKGIPKREANKIRLGYASAWDKNKGAELIIRLVHGLEELGVKTGKELTLHCIAYGREMPYYLDKFNGHKNLIIHPPFTKADIPKFYREIDILLFPTLNESLGLVGLEAMSCNVPVAGTDDFALKDYIISRKTGERFLKNDYSSFQQAIQKIIENRNVYKPRQLVLEKYSREKVVKGYKNLFDSALIL